MSPVAKKSKSKAKGEPQAWDVPQTDGPGRVVVTCEPRDVIGVRWFCGGGRTFSAEHLALSIDNLERVHGLGEDLWISFRDSEGARFAARVVDGEFYADDEISQSAGHVSWAALLDALKNALRPAPAARARARKST
jgi:hypothetical protein